MSDSLAPPAFTPPHRAWRRAIALVSILVAMVMPMRVTAAQTADLDISSERYIVVDAETGEVFAAKGADDEVAIASLTKVFTTIEALERAPLDLEITTKESDLFDANSTTMGFGPGETFTLRDLLYGMMLPSGNDAAHAIARAIGRQPGDSDEEAVDRFMQYVNERVDRMGLTGTRLVNPHGWGVPGHYSSARDVAAFVMYALQYPTFVDVIAATEYTTGNGYTVVNTNRLLNSYSGLLGGKTGYDDDAGYCLVEVARRDGSTMISVTLDGVAPDVWYQDNAVLLDYAFAQKAQRLESGRGVGGNAVSFRDPDAAVIAAIATSGASIGQAQPLQDQSPAPAAAEPVPVAAVAGTTAAVGASAWSLAAALLVAALVVTVSVAGRFFGDLPLGIRRRAVLRDGIATPERS